MKIGIVVPYSWSFRGGVVEHAEHQARSLRKLGIETRTIAGYDPPGGLTRLCHPRAARNDSPPADMLAIGRSVVIPANDSLSNVVLDPRAFFRFRRILDRERFDLLHLHEPLMPIAPVAALAVADVPIVATFHASGELSWLKLAKPLYGFLVDRIDHRIAVSEQARKCATRYFPGCYDVIPNGVVVPSAPDPRGRGQRVVFVGRHERRKGLEVLLRAWPTVRRTTGARLRLIGADPLAVRLLMRRCRVHDDGIDVLGVVGDLALTEELLAAKALVAPSLNGESFGMVLTRAFACATPVVASDIAGYRDVVTREAGVTFPAGNAEALACTLAALLEDEPRRQALGSAAHELARKRYSWDDLVLRLVQIYERQLKSADTARGQVPRGERMSSWPV